MIRAFLLAAAALVPACGTTDTAPEDSSAAQARARSRPTVKEVAPAQAYEIRFGSELAGYLIEILPPAEGQPDTRAYAPGTSLIQDLDHGLLGYISPRGTTYRIDEAGETRTVGFGSRNTSITAFFRKNDPPTLTPVAE